MAEIFVSTVIPRLALSSGRFPVRLNLHQKLLYFLTGLFCQHKLDYPFMLFSQISCFIANKTLKLLYCTFRTLSIHNSRH